MKESHVARGSYLWIRLFAEEFVEQGGTLLGQGADACDLFGVGPGRHVGFVAVLVIEFPDREVRFDGLGHVDGDFVQDSIGHGEQFGLLVRPALRDEGPEALVLPQTPEPVVLDIGGHPESGMDHQARQRLITRMRYALVVVPTLVAIPDRTEEKFVDSAAFVHVGARITVQIAGQLLDDDEVRKGLFVEVFAPAVLAVLVTGGVKRLLGPVDECGDILVLLGFALVVLRSEERRVGKECRL